MKARATVITVTKDNKVLFVESNLKDFLRGFELMVDNAPHYNTLYKKFANGETYEKDGFCYQKFTAEQINDFVLSSANAQPEN